MENDILTEMGPKSKCTDARVMVLVHSTSPNVVLCALQVTCQYLYYQAPRL